MKREVDWLLLQTSGKEYFTVVSVQGKKEQRYPFPTQAAAERFAGNGIKHPGISLAQVLDPGGRVVVEFKPDHKHVVSWNDTGSGMTETRTCTNNPRCKEI